MQKIYLAGAMEAYENTNEAKEWRDKVVEYFKNYSDDFECVSPVEYYSYSDNCSKRSSEIMRFDLRKVRETNILLVNLKDIRKSVGTCDEIFYAYMKGNPIIGFIETSDNAFAERNYLENYVHPWKYEQIDRIEVGQDALFDACEYIKNFYY